MEKSPKVVPLGAFLKNVPSLYEGNMANLAYNAAYVQKGLLSILFFYNDALSETTCFMIFKNVTKSEPFWQHQSNNIKMVLLHLSKAFCLYFKQNLLHQYFA